MDAEKQKTESHADHHKKADIFSLAEKKVSAFFFKVENVSTLMDIRFSHYTAVFTISYYVFCFEKFLLKYCNLCEKR